MQNNSSGKPRMALIAFFSVIISIIIIDACHKVDFTKEEQTQANPVDKFFRVPVDTKPTVKRMIEMMQQYNLKHDFVTNLVKKHGYPIWNKCPILYKINSIAGTGHRGQAGGGSDTLVIVPITKDQDVTRVSSFLTAAVRADSINIRIFNTDEYAGYSETDKVDTLSSETVAGMSMYLEGLVTSGRDSFNLDDKNLFLDKRYTDESDSIKMVSVNVSTTGGVGGRNSVIIDGEEEICNTYNVHHIHRGTIRSQSLSAEPDIQYTICTTIPGWVSLADNEPGLTIMPGGGGNSGNLDQQVNCSNFPGADCGIAPHLGWHPIDQTGGGDGFDPYQADSVRVDNQILDSFPCVYHLIKDTLYNANVTTQVAMQQFFTLNMKNHVYFEINWSLDCSSGFNAYTKPNGNRSVVGGVVNWTDTIQLNPCFLRTASKEKIVQVLLHEPIHAFITWCTGEYGRTTPHGQGLVDSTYLKDHFGIYWEALTNLPYNHVADHDLMVHNFLRYMEDIVFEHSNPNSPEALRRWVAKMLSASGLQESSAWGTAPGVTDTCNIYGVDYWARFHKSGSAPTNPFTPSSGCRSFDTGFRDSLQGIRADSCN